MSTGRLLVGWALCAATGLTLGIVNRANLSRWWVALIAFALCAAWMLWGQP